MGPKAFYMDHKKNPAVAGFFVNLIQSGLKRLDLGAQTALMASNLVFREDTLYVAVTK